jgi:hypothetical protein
VIGTGALLVVLVAGGSAALWGLPAAVPAAVMGLVAMAIQAGARRLRRVAAPNARSPFPPGWLAGTALRILGIGVFLALVLVDRERFAPLPAALGYLGVLVPLLLLELRHT